MVNPLLKTVRIFGRIWVAHSYLASPKNNKKIDNFSNWPSIHVLTCGQWDYKLNILWKKIDECSLTLIINRHWHVFFLTCWPTNIKWRLVLLIDIVNKTLCNSLTASKYCDRKYQETTDLKLAREKMIHEILIRNITNIRLSS